MPKINAYLVKQISLTSSNKVSHIIEAKTPRGALIIFNRLFFKYDTYCEIYLKDVSNTKMVYKSKPYLKPIPSSPPRRYHVGVDGMTSVSRCFY